MSDSDEMPQLESEEDYESAGGTEDSDHDSMPPLSDEEGEHQELPPLVQSEDEQYTDDEMPPLSEDEDVDDYDSDNQVPDLSDESYGSDMSEDFELHDHFQYVAIIFAYLKIRNAIPILQHLIPGHVCEFHHDEDSDLNMISYQRQRHVRTRQREEISFVEAPLFEQHKLLRPFLVLVMLALYYNETARAN